MTSKRGLVIEQDLIMLRKDIFAIESELRQAEEGGEDINKSIRETRLNAAELLSRLGELRMDINDIRGMIEEEQFASIELMRDQVEFEEKIGIYFSVLEDRIDKLEEGLKKISAESEEPLEEGDKKVGGEKILASYQDARGNFKKEEYDLAKQKFEIFLKEYPDSNYADNALFWWGMCFYEQEEYQKAIMKFEEVIQKYPKGNKVPDALFHEGLSFHGLGDKESAKYLLEEFQTKYPKADQIPLVKRILKEIK